MQSATRPSILDDLSALADGTRSRILLALDGRELTVSELCSVLQLPQSTVSRHLKVLSGGGWTRPRREGTRRLYSLPGEELSPAARRLWSLTRDQVGASSDARQDARRLERVLGQRRSASRRFFATAAGRWDRMRDELFGSRFYILSLLGLLPEELAVADLGCGTGPLSEALAPFVAKVYAVDGVEPMLDAARERLAPYPNVEVLQGELEALPLGERLVDVATLILVLHHLPDPAKVIAEVARILRPGGRLLIVDMLPHDREEFRQQMGHVWLGFREAQIGRLLAAAGLRAGPFRQLPPDPAAKGPGLFAVVGVLSPAKVDEPYPVLPDQPAHPDRAM